MVVLKPAVLMSYHALLVAHHLHSITLPNTHACRSCVSLILSSISVVCVHGQKDRMLLARGVTYVLILENRICIYIYLWFQIKILRKNIFHNLSNDICLLLHHLISLQSADTSPWMNIGVTLRYVTLHGPVRESRVVYYEYSTSYHMGHLLLSYLSSLQDPHPSPPQPASRDWCRCNNALSLQGESGHNWVSEGSQTYIQYIPLCNWCTVHADIISNQLTASHADSKSECSTVRAVVEYSLLHMQQTMDITCSRRWISHAAARPRLCFLQT